jgi:YidC/Oxa1 family membrane protein insertase
MFTTFIVQPIFNLLVFIYAILPGHNFGLALIIFTIIIRLLLWPLLKKQLHQAKAMRKLQPEIKKVKAAAKGDRTKESQMLMELYKERGINPFATFPTLIVQLIVLIGLYSGLRKIINDPHTIVTFAYAPLQHLPWMKELAKNITKFDDTFLHFVNLSKAAINKGSGIYWPAMFIVIGSAVAQYYQSKQLMPDAKDQRSLRDILKGAGSGTKADQSEVNAAVGKTTRYLLPVMIFFFTVSIASALSLYWLTGGIVAYIQQSIALREDEEEMEEIADKPSKNVEDIPEAEIIDKPANKNKKSSSSKSKKSAKKRKKK